MRKIITSILALVMILTCTMAVSATETGTDNDFVPSPSVSEWDIEMRSAQQVGLYVRVEPEKTEDGITISLNDMNVLELDVFKSLKDQGVLQTILDSVNISMNSPSAVALMDIVVTNEDGTSAADLISEENPLRITLNLVGVTVDSGIRVLHYVESTQTWEDVTVECIDGGIVCEFTSLSPVMMVGEKEVAVSVRAAVEAYVTAFLKDTVQKIDEALDGIHDAITKDPEDETVSDIGEAPEVTEAPETTEVPVPSVADDAAAPVAVEKKNDVRFVAIVAIAAVLGVGAGIVGYIVHKKHKK